MAGEATEIVPPGVGMSVLGLGWIPGSLRAPKWRGPCRRLDFKHNQLSTTPPTPYMRNLSNLRVSLHTC